MKKLFLILSAVIVVEFVFVFSGCEESIAPENSFPEKIKSGKSLGVKPIFSVSNG